MEEEEIKDETTPEEVPPETVEPPPSGTVEDMPTYTDNAEANYGSDNLYEISFIKDTVCSSDMQFNTIQEFQACQAWFATESIIAFGNIIVGIVLGVIVVKGLFDSWR